MSKPFIDVLMDKVAAQDRDKLAESERDQLGRDVMSPHWLVLQSLILQEMNGLHLQLEQADLSDPKGLAEFSKLQGKIGGLRRFWSLVEELLVVPTEMKDAPGT